jgi:hypothetical protein
VTGTNPQGPSLFVQSLPGSFADLGPLGAERALEAGAVLWNEGDPGDVCLTSWITGVYEAGAETTACTDELQHL